MLKHIPFYASLLGRPLGKVKATHSHVLVYGTIEAHSFGAKGCIASNDTIASETGLTRGTVKNVLSAISKAGWIEIEYKDELKNVRGRMIPMLEIGMPSLHSDTRHSQMTGASLPDDGGVTPQCPEVTDEVTDEVTSRAGKPRIRKTATFQKEGADIIKAFEDVNPACKRMYPNVTQRQACDDLIDEHGLERVIQVIGILRKTNTMPYVPTITTPIHLRDKWSQLEAAMLKKKSEHKATTEKYKVAF